MASSPVKLVFDDVTHSNRVFSKIVRSSKNDAGIEKNLTL